jgi:hypothetical protein
MGQPQPAPAQPNFGQGGESHDGGDQPQPAPAQPNFGQGDDDDDDDREGGGGGEQRTGGGGNIDIDNSKTPLGDIFGSGTDAQSTIDTILDKPPPDNLNPNSGVPSGYVTKPGYDLGPFGQVTGDEAALALLLAGAVYGANVELAAGGAGAAGAGAAKAVTLAVGRAAAVEAGKTLAVAGAAKAATISTAAVIGIGVAGVVIGGLLLAWLLSDEDPSPLQQDNKMPQQHPQNQGEGMVGAGSAF